MIYKERIYFFSLLVALSALANPRLAAAADLRKVTFSYSAVSMTWYPVKVALEKGFFRSEGLEPQLIQMNGNVATVALANGYIDFSLNISPVLNGAIQGLGTKLVAGLNSRPLFALVVRPEINAPSDLKGKVFAVSSFGNTQAILTEKHLQHLGLKKGEYQLLAMGATPARIAALEKNIAQGSLMPLPTNVQLENKGYRLLGNTAEIVINPIAGLGVHEDKIKKDPDLIQRVIRASLRSLQLLQTNAKDTVKILMAWTRATEKDALRSLELAKPGFSKNGMLTDDDLSIEWNFIQQQTKKTSVPVSVAHDMTLLRDVQTDGTRSAIIQWNDSSKTQNKRRQTMRTLDLLASDSSHLPFLYVFKESKVMEKYGYEIDLHIVGGAKAPTMAHRAKLALAGEIDFFSGLHHETYRERAKGEKRLTYLAQAQNNWDDRLVALPEIKNVEDLKGRKIVCHSKAPCVSGNLRAVLETCGLKPEEINMDVIRRYLRQIFGFRR